METITSNMQAAIREAVAKVPGGQAAAARLIGVSQSLVSHWCVGNLVVPPERCPAIESATGVPVERLRPDVEWLRDAAGRPRGYVVSLGARDRCASAVAA